MHTVKTKVYAKVNLTLEIVGVENGYHMLDSFVANVDIFDTIVVTKRKDKQISVTMKGRQVPCLDLEKNNAYKAAVAFMEKFNTTGVDITVFKDIPIGAGLGGSSADAAGVVNGMAALYEITDEEGLDSLADSLGSDTKYMRYGGFARMRGRGTELEFFDFDETLYFLLICPKSSVSTPECYRLYDKLSVGYADGERTRACIDALRVGDMQGTAKAFYNDLYAAANELNPCVGQAVEKAESLSPNGVTMTGSGSGVLAVFESKELCDWAKSRYSGDGETFSTKTVAKKR